MENKLQFVQNAFSIVAWSKDGFEIRALGVDLGYSYKMLSFKTQDIAEILGLSVLALVQATPVVPGQKTRYKVEVSVK